MGMRQLIYVILSLYLTSMVCPVNGQTLLISGRVIDKKSKEPLPFASLRIAEKSLGTVANERGEFTFHIPEEYHNEIIIVTMLGYSTYESPVWSLSTPKTSATIMLNASPLVLSEVTVRDSLTGRDILELTFNRLTENYESKPYLLHCFYRDIKKVGGTYISLFEAAVKIFDDSFQEPRNKFKVYESVELIEARRSLGYDHKFKSYFKQGNLLEDLLIQNPVRYYLLKNENKKETQIIRKPDSYYQSAETFVVEQKTVDYTVLLFINKKTFAIVKVMWSEPASDKIVGRENNLIGLAGGTTKVFDFVTIQQKMFLNYVTINSKIRWHNAQTKELKFETDLLQQLLVNEVNINTRERIIPEQRMKNSPLYLQQFKYNKTFWENYNFIMDSPENKKILDDLSSDNLYNILFEN
jgi:hypothetical protein